MPVKCRNRRRMLLGIQVVQERVDVADLLLSPPEGPAWDWIWECSWHLGYGKFPTLYWLLILTGCIDCVTGSLNSIILVISIVCTNNVTYGKQPPYFLESGILVIVPSCLGKEYLCGQPPIRSLDSSFRQVPLGRNTRYVLRISCAKEARSVQALLSSVTVWWRTLEVCSWTPPGLPDASFPALCWVCHVLLLRNKP